MRKTLAIFAAVILILAVLAFPILAEETVPEGVIEEVIPTEEEIPIEGTEKLAYDEATNETLVGRIWEYVSVRKTALLTAVGDAALFALALFVKSIQDKRTKLMASDLKIVREDASVASQSGNAVVGVVNELIDGYNVMKVSYDEYKVADGKRDELTRAVMRQNANIIVQNATMLEILKTVYINSRQLPQGVKDLINLEIANCRKLTSDNEALSVVVEAIEKNTEAVPTEESHEE